MAKGGPTGQRVRWEAGDGDTGEKMLEEAEGMKDGGEAIALPPWHRLLIKKLSRPLNQRLTSTNTTAFVHLEEEHRDLVQELATNSSKLFSLHRPVGT